MEFAMQALELRNHLITVFCDIRSDDYTIDTEKLEKMVTDYTCAIVPVYVYGYICQVDEIERIANKYGLILLYDAAYIFGEQYKRKGIITLPLYADIPFKEFDRIVDIILRCESK